MLYILIWIFTFRSVSTGSSIFGFSNNFIRNSHLPLCKNCKFFQPSSYTLNNEFQRNNVDKCSKFGEINIITGEIKYDYADFCRKDEDQCGKKAKYFEPISNTNTSSTTSTVVKDW